MKKNMPKSLESQSWIFFNKMSTLQELAETAGCAKELLNSAQVRKFDPLNKEADAFWIRDFKNTREHLSDLLSTMETRRKDAIEDFFEEKNLLSKRQKAKFTKRNIALKVQIANTHLLIQKMMEMETQLDPTDEI